jgi:hypothetical protein
LGNAGTLEVNRVSSKKQLNAAQVGATPKANKLEESEPLTGGADGKFHRLLEYNTYRQSILVQLPEIQKPAPLKNKSEADKITDAMKMKTHCYTGNLNISLFWEEILQIMIRVMQLYSFFFMVYYEFWPSSVRMYLTPLFTSFMLSFHILD